MDDENSSNSTHSDLICMFSNDGPGFALPFPVFETAASRVPRRNGPLDKDELGRSTWNFLHTMAAYYPENPSEQTQQDCRNFLDILSKLYPCKMCADHFKELLKRYPPRVESRQALTGWLCDVHNIVNKNTGKREFDCKKTDKRWGGGGMTGGGTNAPSKKRGAGD